MQSNTQLKARSPFFNLAGLVVAGMLTACGGGTGSTDNNQDSNDKPLDPPVKTTQFGRIGIDINLFNNSHFGLLNGATIDKDANITFQSDAETPSMDAYKFTFPSGLPGGSIKGNLFSITTGSSKTQVNILTPSATTAVQNVFWINTTDPTMFGFGLAGYRPDPIQQPLPTSGAATYSGKAFQLIVDSNANTPAETTYALYTSEVTASVDYSAKTMTVAIAPSPTYVDAFGKPAVVSADPNLFAANYQLTNLNFSNANDFQPESATLAKSNFGLAALRNGVGFFGSNAENLGGFIQYQGSATLPTGDVTRDQYISFALVKQ